MITLRSPKLLYFGHWSSVPCLSLWRPVDGYSLYFIVLKFCDTVVYFILSIMLNPQWVFLVVVRVGWGPLWRRLLGCSGSLYSPQEDVVVKKIPLGAGFGMKACSLPWWHWSLRCSRVCRGHRTRSGMCRAAVASRSRVQACLL